MEFICMAWMDSMMSTSWQTNKVPIPNWASFHPSPASHEHHSHDQNKHCVQIGKTHGRPAKSPSETLRNGLSNGYNRQRHFFQQGLRTIMQTLHLETAWFDSCYRYNCLLSFEDPVLKHSWQPSCAIHMPFINIIKYLFHYSNFHTIRPLPHRLQSTWNRILNETDNATWSLGHLELWGIFLFNTLMLFCGFSQPEDMFVLMMTLIIINTNMSSGWENPRKTSEITKRNFAQWLEQWLQQAAISFPIRAANNHANITSWNSLVCFLVSIQLSTEFWRSSSETQLTAILCHS